MFTAKVYKGLLLNAICASALLFFTVSLNAQISKTDSLVNILESDEAALEDKLSAIQKFYDINKRIMPDSTLIVSVIHEELAKQSEDQLEMFNMLNTRGNIYMSKRIYEEAMSNFKEARVVAEAIGDSSKIALVIGNVGILHAYQDEFVEATRKFSKALKIYQSLKHELGEIRMLNNLGSIFYTIKNYDQALEYYQKVFSSVSTRPNNYREKAIVLLNLGAIYLNEGNYELSEEKYTKALDISLKHDLVRLSADCYFELGELHFESKKFSSALSYSEKSMEVCTLIESTKGINENIMLQALILYSEDPIKATKMAEKVLSTLSHDSENEFRRDIYKFLYKSYKESDKISEALKMHELYSNYKDSINNKEKNQLLIREAIKSDFEVKLYETKLEGEKAQSVLEMRQFKRLVGIIAISIALLGIAFLFIRKQRNKFTLRKNELLSEIEKLKAMGAKNETSIVSNLNSFSLNRSKIEQAIERQLNETDWSVLNALVENPVIQNKEIAEQVFKSLDGVGSSLRRMYTYFEITDTKYKKISLLMKVIKLSNN